MKCLWVSERNLFPWFLGLLSLATLLRLCFGKPDDIVAVHVFQEHLVDEAESHLTLQSLHMLIGFGSFWSVQLAGLVGVEPCCDGSMSGGEPRTLFPLFFGRRPMARLRKSRDAYLPA